MAIGQITVNVGVKGMDERKAVINALNLLGVALTEHDHQWTNEERGAYEKAMRILSKVK